MSESFRHETPQFEGLDIERITRRIADTTGKTEFDPTQRHLTDSVLTFDTQHGGGLGQAALLLIPGRAIDRNTNTYNVVEAVRVPIGHYDPADKEWQLYGELIAEGEKESVSVTLDNLSFSLKPIYEERARVGLPYVDLFHPVTHLARKEMSDRLKDHELASSIFDRNKVAALQQGSQVQDAVIDPSTSCHFVVQTLPFRRTLITSEGADQLVERVDGLYIAYDGLRLNDNNMHI